MFSERLLTAVMRRTNDRVPHARDRPASTSCPRRSRDARTCSTCTSRSASGCARTARSTASRTTPSARPRYFKHLRDEMRMVAELGYDFQSLYVGGGTPTIDIDELVATIDLAKSLFSIKEVSSRDQPQPPLPAVDRAARRAASTASAWACSASTTSCSSRWTATTSTARRSEILERLQSIEGAFHSLNVDMIFNFPSQTAEKLATDIELVKRTGANQTTFYPLMASPAVRESLKRTVGTVDYAREYRYYQQIVRGAERHVRACERVDVLAHRRRHDRRVHRRLRGLRGHRQRRVLASSTARST